ncbi:unnamed protein product [Ectocarpus sp. 12 AP-2014]
MWSIMKIKTKFKNSNILNIVGDGAIGTQDTADGRIIPVLILKNENNNNLESLIKIHEDTPPGDAQSMWAKQRFNSKTLYLVVRFAKPLEVEIAIEFDLSAHHVLVDAILYSKCVYLQPGAESDRVSDDINAPKVLVEIPSGTTLNDWDITIKKILVKKLKSNGFSRKEASKAADEHLARQRELWGNRFKRPVA